MVPGPEVIAEYCQILPKRPKELSRLVAGPHKGNDIRILLAHFSICNFRLIFLIMPLPCGILYSLNQPQNISCNCFQTFLPQVAETKIPQPQDVTGEFFLYDECMIHIYVADARPEEHTDLQRRN